MHVKRFEAADMPEALRLVKHELGPNAVILSTRQIKKGGGAFGIFGRSFVEVTAAVDREAVEAPLPRPVPPPAARESSPPPVAPRSAAADPLPMSRGLDPLQRDVEQMKELLQQLVTKDRLTPPVNLHGLEREFSAVKRMVELLVRKQQDSSTPLFVSTLIPCYQRLLASGMDEALARHLVEKAQNSLDPEKLADPQAVQEHVASLVIKSTPISGPLRAAAGAPIVAAFVGPTGVGKTTTIAKLAAHYALGEKRKVALVTLDTYRIAAVEQLRLFAKIIGLSVEVVLTASELEQALTRHRETDVVLIDTAGRSQRDTLQMAELSAFFADNERVDVHLVLSATASAPNLSDTVSRFKPLGVTSLVFTKLDESTSFGALLSTACHTLLPLSYFTTGQRVPEDIEVATPERVVDLILNVSQWHAEAYAMERG
ncbi:MAG: flagellar biosynthesis protein FlhF [Candidatus Tectimicrobiota bacterium]